VLLMLALGSVFLIAGAAQKAPCANEAFAATHSGASIPCYSDVAVAIRTEELSGRLPYLDACNRAVCDEYPVGTMYVMAGAAWVTGGRIGPFYTVNVLIFLGCVALIIWALERLHARTVLFAAAPTLLLYGTLNWDLLAVASATIATYLLLVRRPNSSGIALGVGAAIKLYPALLAGPFAWHLVTRRRTSDARNLALGTVTSWAVLNLPFVFLATSGWIQVFAFNRARGVDFESLWRLPCSVGMCPSSDVLNGLIATIVVVSVAAIWTVVLRRVPEEPRWLLSFPLLVVIVVTGKFWSPQYALWLLPWFALTRIPTRVWLAYQLSEVLEFIVRSAFMSGSLGSQISLSWLLLTVALRAVLLLRCVWWWMRDPEPTPGIPSDSQRADDPSASSLA
jgi:Glycosyltransferase family 87